MANRAARKRGLDLTSCDGSNWGKELEAKWQIEVSILDFHD